MNPAYAAFIAYAGPDLTTRRNSSTNLNATLPTFVDYRCLFPEDDFDIALLRAQAACLITVPLILTNTPESFYGAQN